MRLSRSTSILLIALALPGAAVLGGDGALEINQACALNGGCFQGDDAGFPVQITKGGSYRLTSNLDLAAAAQPETTGAIFVEASDVNIDLAGFTIAGTNSCTRDPGFPVTGCDNEGFANGISNELGSRNITVRNGTVRGMTTRGIALAGSGSEVIGVEARDNGGGGIGLGEDALVRDVTAVENGETGVVVLERSSIVRSRTSFNQTHGFQAGSGSSITDSVAVTNDDVGFRAMGATLIKDCVARFNLLNGVVLEDRTGAVIDSVLVGNQAEAIACVDGGAVKGSTLDGNVGGSIDSNCTEIGTNLCEGDTNC
jgi:hypothetical protein